MIASNDKQKPSAEPVVKGVCSKCGRSVAGFPGDYARCDKCEHMQMLSSDPPPGWRMAAGGERLTQLPFWFTTLFYASIGVIVWTGGGSDTISSIIVVLVFAGWIFSIMQFSKAAERQRGWWIPVLEYHIVALLMIPGFMCAAGALMALVNWTIDGMTFLWMLFAAVIMFISLLLYGDARRRIAHLKIIRR
ncbi:MAG TPA: hypothetical protein PKN33_12895 [Phycisphaerae bacterium]|nr:hypothetical protein [Phycisphaerae bacterium]